MTREVTCTLGQLPGLIKRDLDRLDKRLDTALQKTAQQSVAPIRERTPRAFGELQESVQYYARGESGNRVVDVDAPHAGAVEKGSPPHKPDFEKLLAWVKLRGLQGLTGRGKVRGNSFRKDQGPTTARQARRVSSMLKSHEVRGRKGVGRHSPTDAPEKVAMAISRGIEKHGTKPHWFVRSALGEVRTLLAANVDKAVHGS